MRRIGSRKPAAGARRENRRRSKYPPASRRPSVPDWRTARTRVSISAWTLLASVSDMMSSMAPERQEHGRLARERDVALLERVANLLLGAFLRLFRAGVLVRHAAIAPPQAPSTRSSTSPRSAMPSSVSTIKRRAAATSLAGASAAPASSFSTRRRARAVSDESTLVREVRVGPGERDDDLVARHLLEQGLAGLLRQAGEIVEGEELGLQRFGILRPLGLERTHHVLDMLGRHLVDDVGDARGGGAGRRRRVENQLLVDARLDHPQRRIGHGCQSEQAPRRLVTQVARQRLHDLGGQCPSRASIASAPEPADAGGRGIR